MLMSPVLRLDNLHVKLSERERKGNNERKKNAACSRARIQMMKLHKAAAKMTFYI